jgi:hypothetical protein
MYNPASTMLILDITWRNDGNPTKPKKPLSNSKGVMRRADWYAIFRRVINQRGPITTEQGAPWNRTKSLLVSIISKSRAASTNELSFAPRAIGHTRDRSA